MLIEIAPVDKTKLDIMAVFPELIFLAVSLVDQKVTMGPIRET